MTESAGHLRGTRRRGVSSGRVWAIALTLIGGAMLLVGCTSGYIADARVINLVARAEFGRAREALYMQERPNPGLTDLLDATKKGMMSLADGLPDAADRDFEAVFDMLRTQGVNEDRTTESIFVNEEGVRVWKGEPFEQAMAYAAIAENDASRGDWGNARAAAENALFHLRDYSESEDGDIRYRSVESTFALGYMIRGIAALEMQRREEAEESFARAVEAHGALRPVVERLLSGRYDTVLFIDYGLGPRREAVGPGGVGIAYRARTPSDDAPVRVSWSGGETSWPHAADVNAMSADARWQSRESIRRFKQGLGQGLMLGGAVLASTGGTDEDDDIARLAAGAGLVALGAVAQSNARADTRHNELLPQRVYIAPLELGGSRDPVRVEIEGHPGSRMTLHGLWVREPGEHVVRYVRLPLHPVAWADAEAVAYGNDATGPLEAPTLPWILGGRDARYPDHAAALDYERAGLDLGDTPGELRELYRLEGIRLFPMDDQRLVSGHIFEGGHSLFTPLPGTTGFTRLFGREQARYQPMSEATRELIARLEAAATRAGAHAEENTR